MQRQQQRPANQYDQRQQQRPPMKIDTLKKDTGALAIRDVPTDEVLYELMAENNWLNLSPDQRLAGYKARCDAIGLDPMTFPFEFIEFTAGKVTLYPTRAATDQLRRIYGVSCKITGEGYDKPTDTLWAKAEAIFPDGRSDEDIAYLFCYGKGGLDLANMRMKVITKAKRRVTLSAIGLGQMAERGDDYDEGRYIKKHELDLSSGAIDAGEVRPPIDIWRKLHWKMGQRITGGDAHAMLRCIAAALLDRTGSLKLIGDDNMQRLFAYIDEAEADELAGAIELGAEKLDIANPNIAATMPVDAPESRQTNETVVNDESVADGDDHASGDHTDATDAEFAEVDPYDAAVGAAMAGIVDDLDTMADSVADPDDVPFVDTETGEINAAESRVLDFLAVIADANTKRAVDKVAADITAAGVSDPRIDAALAAKYDRAKEVQTKAATPAEQKTFTQTGAPGDDRFTNS